MFYRVFRLLCRVALGVYYRRLEVEGAPDALRGPVIFVANHPNALIDPLMLIVSLRRRVTLTVKNVLSRNPLLRLLIHGLGAISLHRREDVGRGADPCRNRDSLRRCREVLARGGALCVFPEGASHSEPGLRPFKKGAAQIALELGRAAGADPRLRLVPVALLYTDKRRFRSDVWLRFGRGLDVARFVAENPGAGAAELTAELRRRVEALGCDAARPDPATRRAAELLATGGTMPAPLGRGRPAVSDWFRLVGRVRSLRRAHREADPVGAERLDAALLRHRQQLEQRGVPPRELYLPLAPARALLFLGRELELLAVGAPFALAGALANLVPTWGVRRIARRLSRDEDHWASNTVYPGFVLFPACHALQLAVLASWLGPAAGLGYALLVPYLSVLLPLYFERARAALRRARAFVALWRDRAGQRRLARRGRALIRVLRGLERRLAPAAAAAGGGSEFEAQLGADAAALRGLVAGIGQLGAEFLDSGVALEPQRRGYFTPAEEQRLRWMLAAFRGHRAGLWEIIERYRGYAKLEEPVDQLRAFMLGYAAALTTYANCLRLIRACERSSLLRRTLNQADPEQGLPAGFVDEVLEANTSPHNAILLARARGFWRSQAEARTRTGLDRDPDYGWIADLVAGQASITRRSLGQIVGRRLRYALRALGEAALGPLGRALYAARACSGAALFASRHRRVPAVDVAVLEAVRRTLEPGDLVLVRARGRLAAALVPGFWSHVAVFLGDPPAFHDLAPAGLGALPGDGRWGYVVDALADRGVSVRPLEQCLAADDVAVLRPRLSPGERRDVLGAVLGHLGKPYDFEFDFGSAERIVCTELIYRCYDRHGGIELPLVRRFGRFTLTPDDLVEKLLARGAHGAAAPACDLVWLGLRLADAHPHDVPGAPAPAVARAAATSRKAVA